MSLLYFGLLAIHLAAGAALAGFLIEAIGPEYPDDPDAEAERFFDRYHSGDWICPTAIRIEGK